MFAKSRDTPVNPSTFGKRSGLRETETTLTPSPANILENANPNPEVPPVIKAVL
jgi:hypothetical protein